MNIIKLHVKLHIVFGLGGGVYLLQAGQQEGLQALTAGVGPHLTDVVEEGRPHLPVAVIQEGDHRRQQEVIAFPASNEIMITW